MTRTKRAEQRNALYHFVKAYKDAIANDESWYGALDRISEFAFIRAVKAYENNVDTDDLQELEQQAQEDIEAGRVTRHKDVDSAVEHLEGLDK